MASIFGAIKNKTSNYFDELKARRQAEAQAKEEYKTSQRKEQGRNFSEETRQKAIDHVKTKAYNIMNDDKANLSKRIKAINEFYKDHTKPKVNNAMQDLSDRSYVNHFRRDMRMERVQMLKKAVAEDKVRLKSERFNKMMEAKNRYQANKLHHQADILLRQARNELRMRN